MRSGLLAVIAAGAAACAPATGLQFEIDTTGDPTATEVVIYIGKGDGQAASIAAEQRTPNDRHKGQFWPLGLDPERFQLTAGERTATISFAPAGDSSKVTIVALGLTNGAPTSVATQAVTEIRTDVVEVWTLTLEPIKDDVDSSTGRAAQRWGEDPGDHTCVQAVDRGTTEPEPTNLFIGTSGDRDCDGHPKLKDGVENPAECDDDWHDASETPSVKTLSCMEEKQSSVAVSGVCLIGARECTDGKPELRTECSHTKPFCAPQSLCDGCATGTAQEQFACALALDPQQHSIPYLLCPIEVDTTATPPKLCTRTLFASAPTAWQVDLAACTGTPAFHSANPAAGWTSTTSIGGIGLAFSPMAPGGVCNTTIAVAVLPGATINPSAPPNHGLVAAELGAGAGVVAPILFTIVEVDSCVNAERACDSVVMTAPPETITRCVQRGGVP